MLVAFGANADFGKSICAKLVWNYFYALWAKIGITPGHDPAIWIFSLDLPHTPRHAWTTIKRHIIGHKCSNEHLQDHLYPVAHMLWRYMSASLIQTIWCAHLQRMDSDPIESTAEMAIMMTRLEAGMRNLTRLAEAQAGDSDGHTVAAVLKAYADCFLSQTDAIPLTPNDTRGVYLLFFDGGSRGNPGPGGTGSIIVRVHKDSHTASLIWAASMAYSRKDTTNNFAEYWGLIHGLREAQRSHFEPLHVIGDSALIISQQRMHRSPRQHRLACLYQTSRRLADCIDIRGWYHHYRAFNKMADSAANLAMDTRTSTQVHFPTHRAAFNNLTQDLDNDVMHWLMRSSEDPRSLDNTRQPHIGPREHAILVKDYLATLLRLKANRLSMWNYEKADLSCSNPECSQVVQSSVQHLLWECPKAKLVWNYFYALWAKIGITPSHDPAIWIFSLDLPDTPRRAWTTIKRHIIGHKCSNEHLQDHLYLVAHTLWRYMSASLVQTIWCAHLRRMDSDPIESTAEMAIMMTRLEAGMRNLARLAEAQAGDSGGHTFAAVLKAYVDCFLSQTDTILLTPNDTRGIYLLFFDGGSRGNPGPGGTGSITVRVHKDSHTASVIWAASMAYSRKDTTNNLAEYWGLIHGLREAQRSHFEPLYVIGDSALIISQQRMHRSPRQHRLARLYQTSRRLADCIDIRGWYHHYRAFNKMADSAANLAMDTRTSTQVHFPTQRAAFNNLTQDLDNDVMHWLMRTDLSCSNPECSQVVQSSVQHLLWECPKARLVWNYFYALWAKIGITPGHDPAIWIFSLDLPDTPRHAWTTIKRHIIGHKCSNEHLQDHLYPVAHMLWRYMSATLIQAIWCAHLRRMDSGPIKSTAEMAIMMTRLEAGMRNLTRLAEAQAGDSDGHTVAAVLKAYVDCFLSQTDTIPLTPSDTRGVYLLFFDGGSRGNPGPGGTGSIIVACP
ncbi:reverse transcriptase, partial [Globisporangium splendens]